MNLWLDDVRPAPPGWVHARTAEEAAHYLATGHVVNASLDHDLGRERDGTWLVRWMIEYRCWPRNRPNVHSANPVGAARMRGMIKRYGPYR